MKHKKEIAYIRQKECMVLNSSLHSNRMNCTDENFDKKKIEEKLDPVRNENPRVKEKSFLPYS